MPAATAHLLRLRDGTCVAARPIEPGDKPALASFFERLSEESRYRRFLGPKPKLTSRDLAFLTEVDGDRHVALVALDGDGAIVAVARYAAWLDRPGHSEIAFAVADDWHGRGLATALVERLVAHASRAGVATLTASTLADNAAAQALLRRSGFTLRRMSAGVAEFELELVPVALPAAA